MHLQKNELINLCEEIVSENIVLAVSISPIFSIFTGESADICGKE